MAKATVQTRPTYLLELTEDEANTLFTLLHTMVCGSSNPGDPRKHTDDIAGALERAGAKTDRTIRKSWQENTRNLRIERDSRG